MGYRLRRAVLESLPDALDPTSRFVLAELAEMTDERTGRLHPDAGSNVAETLCCRTGLKPTGLKDVCRRLARVDLDPRVSFGVGKDGRDLFAVPGRTTEYRLPSSLINTYPQGEATASPSQQGEATASAGEATASPGEATASAGEATASPLPNTNGLIPTTGERPGAHLGDTGGDVGVVVEKFNINQDDAAAAVAAMHADDTIRNVSGFVRSPSLTAERVHAFLAEGRSQAEHAAAAGERDRRRCPHGMTDGTQQLTVDGDLRCPSCTTEQHARTELIRPQGVLA